MPTLSVAVPATDTPPTLTQCLAAIATADDGPDEVIVVDEPVTLSAAAARNAGAQRASGDILVFVDADVVVHADAFRRIRQAFVADPDLTAVYGSYDDAAASGGTVSAFRNLLHHHIHQESAGPAETFWTGLGAIRRHVLLDAGGFDERRFPHPSVEDIDLGSRLHASGARIALDPTIQGTHLKAWTLRSMVWTDFARRGVPWVALQVRNRRLCSTLNLRWRHRLSAVAVVVAAASAVLVPMATVVGAGAVVGLNRSFYGLLVRRLGPSRAVAGVALHCLHHLVALAAVPAGVARAAWLWARAPDGAAACPSPNVPSGELVG